MCEGGQWSSTVLTIKFRGVRTGSQLYYGLGTSKTAAILTFGFCIRFYSFLTYHHSPSVVAAVSRKTTASSYCSGVHPVLKFGFH